MPHQSLRPIHGGEKSELGVPKSDFTQQWNIRAGENFCGKFGVSNFSLTSGLDFFTVFHYLSRKIIRKDSGHNMKMEWHHLIGLVLKDLFMKFCGERR